VRVGDAILALGEKKRLALEAVLWVFSRAIP
jgi:hypothetical protein